MTWKEQRIVTFLGSILLILMAALLVVLGLRYQENRDREETGSLISDETGTAEAEDAYTALLYDNGSATLSFSRSETGSWLWDGNHDFPLDDAVISAILAEVVNWAPQQTLTDADALEKSGLSEPTASLSATTSGGDTTTLLFGKSAGEEGSHYVRRNGDEKTVYVLDDTLYQLMCTPIYDMCRLPKLPALTEDLLNSVSVYGMAETDEDSALITVLSAHRAEEEDTTWRYNGANVTDLPAVRALVEDVAALDITKCIDYNPSDEALELCGLDMPVAKLYVSYTSVTGTEASLRIEIGGTLLDGSGRYIRLDDDTTVYFLPNEVLDPLLEIAAEGLEA